MQLPPVWIPINNLKTNARFRIDKQVRCAKQWAVIYLVSSPGAGSQEKNYIKAKNMPLFNPHRMQVPYKRTDALGTGEVISRFPVWLQSLCKRLHIPM
jgi:hypothetical protein